MRRVIYIIVLVSVFFAFGCVRNEVIDKPKEGVRVELSGSMGSCNLVSRAAGMIDPIGIKNLPPEQLEIGIVTIEYDSSIDPTIAQWGVEAYDPYLDRGFFGGNVIGDNPLNMGANWNGNIEYTNRDGDALQTVFYDETGVYYYLVAFYPYNDIHDLENVDDGGNSMILDDILGAMVIFDVDGSQDIMSTQLGKGNIEPLNRVINPLVFKHRLTSLKCLFVAESQIAAEIYGDIISVELIEQPDKLGLNIGVSANDVGDPIFDVDAANIGIDVSLINYPFIRYVGSIELPYPSAAAPVEFGYVLAMSMKEYTFRIVTENRIVYATYDFDPANTGNPALLPKPGYIYHLIFEMMESAEISLEVGDITERWIDQRFD